MVRSDGRADGWYNMVCWNGLSTEQQARLIHQGGLPFGYTPEGECKNGADVAVEVRDDMAPGPRFYCYGCAADYTAYLAAMDRSRNRHPANRVPDNVVPLHGEEEEEEITLEEPDGDPGPGYENYEYEDPRIFYEELNREYPDDDYSWFEDSPDNPNFPER